MKESLRTVGQRFMIGFDGFEASADVKRLIRDYGVGQVIYFARNVASPEQVAELSKELQTFARECGHALPLVIGVDQEGGLVDRVGAPSTGFPAFMAAGAADDPALTRKAARASAAEMRGLGFDVVFAPVADVTVGDGEPVELTMAIRNQLLGIQLGEIEDPHNWMWKVC